MPGGAGRDGAGAIPAGGHGPPGGGGGPSGGPGGGAGGVQGASSGGGRGERPGLVCAAGEEVDAADRGEVQDQVLVSGQPTSQGVGRDYAMRPPEQDDKGSGITGQSDKGPLELVGLRRPFRLPSALRRSGRGPRLPSRSGYPSAAAILPRNAGGCGPG